jgi:hypothetical protein
MRYRVPIVISIVFDIYSCWWILFLLLFIHWTVQGLTISTHWKLLSFHFTVERHLSWFQLFTITSDTVKNILVQVFWGIWDNFPRVYILEVQLLDYLVWAFDHVTLLSKLVVVIIYTHTSSWGRNPIALQTHMEFCQVDEHEETSHWSFNSHFPDY